MATGIVSKAALVDSLPSVKGPGGMPASRKEHGEVNTVAAILAVTTFA